MTVPPPDCYGWPRRCEHYDDLDCFQTEYPPTVPIEESEKP